MITSPTTTEIFKALVAVHGEIDNLPKTKDNPFYDSKYFDNAAVRAALREPLKKHGLAVIQEPLNENGSIGIRTMIIHTSGEFIMFHPFYATPDKSSPQGAGSTLTYIERYATCAAFGIGGIDDDGNAAEPKPAEPSFPKTTTNIPPPKGPEEGQTTDEMRADIKKWILEISGGNKEEALDRLEAITEFTVTKGADKGKVIPGVRDTHKLSAARTAVVHHKVHKAYDEFMNVDMPPIEVQGG